jgi:hypothetical protein
MDRRSNRHSYSQEQYSNPWDDEDHPSEYNYYNPRNRELELEREEELHRKEEEKEKEKGKEKASMSSWLQRAASSSQAQFAATAIVSGAVVAGAIFGYQAVQRRERVQDLKRGIPEVGRGHVVDKVGCISSSGR